MIKIIFSMLSLILGKRVYYKLFDVDNVTDISYYYFCSKEVDEKVHSQWLLVQDEVKSGNCPDRYYASDYIQCNKLKFNNVTNLINCMKNLETIRKRVSQLK